MPQSIGRYTIESELGHGAFGRVYRAFDPNLKIAVAIKVLLAAEDPELRARFEIEARANAGLLHKNIVTVYEFGQHEGKPFLVMELLEGQTLEAVIQTGNKGLLEKMEIMHQIAEGLQYAHSRGVLHRDMKPSNVMVPNNGAAKIMDFGIARLLDRAATGLSQKGDFVGTIAYMAPEQINGGQADRQTDIWAYGVTFYELLTGVQPFHASDPGTVMYRIDSYDPPAPSGSDAEIPVSLDSLIKRLLSKERELRIETMEDVLIDVQPILQHLRQRRAAAIAEEVRPRIEAADFDAVKGKIDEILRLDPLNVEAGRWRNQRLEKAQRDARWSKAEKLTLSGKEHVEQRRLAEAVRCFENALALAPERSEIQALVDSARSEFEKARKAARLIAEAHWDLQRKQPERALAQVQSALDLDPENAEGKRLSAELTKQIREQRIAAAVKQAEERRARGEFDAALDAFQDLEPEVAASPEIGALRARIEAERADAEKRRRAEALKKAVDAARALLDARQLAQAQAAVKKILEDFPDETSARRLSEEIEREVAAQRRTEVIGTAIESARSGLRDKRFEEALAALRKALESYPGDERLENLAQLILQLQATHLKSEAIRAALQEGERLRGQGDLEPALRVVAAALEKYPGDIALLECTQKIQLERARRERAERLNELLSEASRLVQAQRAADAIALLEKAETFATEPEVARLLAAAREQEAIRAAHADVASLEARGELARALSSAETAQKLYPSDAPLAASVARLREKIRERERAEALTAARDAIQSAVRAGSFDDALAKWRAASSQFPGDAALIALEKRIEEGRAKALWTSLADDVLESVARSDFARTAEVLAGVPRPLTGEPGWPALWRDIDETLARSGDPLGALIAALDRSRVAHPEPSLIADNLNLVRDAASKLRETRVQEALDRAAREERAGNHAQAAGVIGQAVANYGVDAALERAAARVAETIAGEEKIRAIAAAAEAIRQSIAAGDLAAADSALAAARSRLGDHPEFAPIPAAIQTARDAAERKQWYQSVRRRISHGEFRQALAAMIGARERFSGDADWEGLWNRLQLRILSHPADLLGSAALLETSAADYAGEPEVAHLLEVVRTAAGALRGQLLQQVLERIAAEENAGRFAEALEQATAALAQHPLQPDATADARQYVERIAEARRRCEQLLAASTLIHTGSAEAGDALAPLLEKYPGHPAVRALAADWSAASERQQREARFAQALIDAGHLVSENEFESALALLHPHSAAFASDPRLIEALQSVQGAKREADRKARLARGMAHTAELLAKGELDSAIRGLLDLRRDFPGDEAIERQLTEIAALRNHQERREAAANARDHAGRLAKAGEFAAAREMMAPFLAEFPDDPALAGAQRAIVQSEATALLRSEFSQCIASGDLMLAGTLLRAARKGHVPADLIDALETELQETARRIERERLAGKKRLKSALSEAARLAESQHFDQAAAQLKTLLREFPGHPEILEQLSIVAQGKLVYERQQQLLENCAKAERWVAEQKFDAAIRLLEQLGEEFPQDESVRQRLRDATAARNNATKSDSLRVYERMSELESLYAKGKARKVRDLALRLLAEVEQPRARELLQWAENMLAQAPADNAGTLWSGLSEMVGRAASRIGKRGATLQLSAAELKFTAHAGARGSPPAQSIAVTGNAGWVARPDSPWIVIQEDPTGVAITVSPRGLAAGTHAGSVLIISADGSDRREIRLQLTVIQ